jgi:hypothetical protein
MLRNIYEQMLDGFGDTLEQTSEDTDETANPVGRGCFMTSSQRQVVNFDSFKNSIAARFELSRSPNSCDALYMYTEDEWFLIEFKNGKLDEETMHQVRGKIFQSLLLLTEQLNNTLEFTRNNVNFILVYNESIEHTARNMIGNALKKLAGGTGFFPFGLDGLQRLFFKDVFAWNKIEFENNFVSKYCNP